ncbi:MAG: hypothetical protein MJ165_02650 [Alphaproteobacteria bacterium]|nr:hypothetical protein [Alphaproteobacteria bacterium]
MNHYYKIVGYYSLFSETYEIYDIHGIESGTHFVAKKAIDPEDVMLQTVSPVLHFGKGALNTLLWYEIFNEQEKQLYVNFRPPMGIYEITPITKVTTGICNDKYKLAQYGAHEIQFGNRIATSQLVLQALDEYKKTMPQIHNRKLATKIQQWQKFVQNKEEWQNYQKIEKMYEL